MPEPPTSPTLPDSGPLAGVSVVDFTLGVAGPYSSMLLGDLGADVLWCEKPGGDAFREVSYSPRFRDGCAPAEGDYSLAINRNKKSLTLDLRTEKGLEIARHLVRDADVVLEAFRPGVMERLGLGYESVVSLNPAVIYGSLTAFGRSGPLADVTSNDLTMQARAGIMSITGHPGGPPAKPGPPLSALVAGVHLCNAIVAALYRRSITGRGQRIDMSILDATLTLLTNFTVGVIDGEADIQALGSAHQSLAPFQAFATRDGSVVIGVTNDAGFSRLCQALGLENLSADPRFERNADRVSNRVVLAEIIETSTRALDSAEVLRVLEERDVACAPVNRLREVFSDPQVASNEMIVEVPHRRYGSLHLLGVPYHYSESPCAIRRPPPRPGEHTAEVLAELGLSEEEISELAQEGVI